MSSFSIRAPLIRMSVSTSSLRLGKVHERACILKNVGPAPNKTHDSARHFVDELHTVGDERLVHDLAI